MAGGQRIQSKRTGRGFVCSHNDCEPLGTWSAGNSPLSAFGFGISGNTGKGENEKEKGEMRSWVLFICVATLIG
jgi:hypothetical protein